MTKGISLHIGLNNVDPKVYPGTAILKGCINDAKCMNTIAKQVGYTETKILTDKDANIEAVISEIKKAASALQEGDIFFISYSGHGTWIKDKNGDESDGQDEAWCLYNGVLIDDYLNYLWSLFKPNTRIIMLSDSCHSGTMLGLTNKDDGYESVKFIDNEITQVVYDNNKQYCDNLPKDKYINVDCSVKLIAACKDNQTSLDGAKNGLFTEKLLKVWNNGSFTGDYNKFYKEIAKLLPEKHKPNYLNIGKQNSCFDKQKPFAIK